MSLDLNRVGPAAIRALVLLLGIALSTGIAAAADPVRATETDGANGNHSGGSRTGIEAVLIQVPKPYGSMLEAIRDAGGEITREYEHFDGLAARIPRSGLMSIRHLTGPGAVTKDLVVEIPQRQELRRRMPAGITPVGEGRTIEHESATAIPAGELAAFAATHPDAYLVNNALSKVDPLHAAGFSGAGVVVAVVDSGIRPGFFHLESDGSVIGCEDFVGDGFPCSHGANGGHGTFVAGMISANAIYSFNPGGSIIAALRRHLPGALIPPNQVPMIGSAPLASIYAMRVFSVTGDAATSDILAAIDRAIDLRERFESGDPGGVKIQVLNMSLGGPTLAAGRDLFDRAVDALLEHDIVVTTSAGNAGPSGMTSGSPASSFSSLAVGAASIPGYERLLVELQFGPTIASLYRPAGHIQTATFSSRGPNADGRTDPDVIASGDLSFGQGFGAVNQVNWASGTSFSAPTVAGIAAVLRQAVPDATARQVHNAIRGSADPSVLGDRSTIHDQGQGYVDASAALALLESGTVPDALPEPPGFVKNVKSNIENGAGLPVVGGHVRQAIGPLRPGERGEVFYEVTPNTSQVIMILSGFNADLPPSDQNQLFGDDLLVTVHEAKTTRQPGSSGYLLQSFARNGTAVFETPETGLLRITINGDWTNAGDVSVDLEVISVNDSIPQLTRQGKITEFQEIALPLVIPEGTSVAEFRLAWREGWARYPVNDVDLVLIEPDGDLNFNAATLDEPESAIVTSPEPGTWTMILFGFELHSPDDKYELRVTLDGEVVR